MARLGRARPQRKLLTKQSVSVTAGTNKTFYLKATVQGGVTFYTLQDGGSPPATATTGTGWTVGTTAAALHSAMEAGAERLASTFGSISGTLPLAPDNTIGNGFRSDAITGTFDAGTWTVNVPLIAVSSGGDQDVRLGITLLKGTNADGSNATYFTAGDSTTITNLTTGAEQIATLGPMSLGALVFAGEYLFLTIQCEILGSGLSGDRDVLIRVGSGAGITTPAFTANIGALAGTASLSFGAGTSTLAGSGALAGSAAIAFAAGSSTLIGAGALAGTADLVFGAGNSFLTSTQLVSGSCDIVFGATLVTGGVSSIAGSAALSFGAGSSTIGGTGAMAGTAALAFSDGASALRGAGALAGSAAITLVASGPLNSGGINGSAALTFGSGASALTGSYALSGSATLTIGATIFTTSGATLIGTWSNVIDCRSSNRRIECVSSNKRIDL